MSRIPFIHAKFIDKIKMRNDLERRFIVFLRKLRGASEAFYDEDEDDMVISTADIGRINTRVTRIVNQQIASTGLTHLQREDRERLACLKDGARLIQIKSEHHADELGAALHDEMPWMAAATIEAWQAMRQSVREGWPGLRLPPLLLDGPPGVGKSYWARRLGELIKAPVTVVEATGEQASFGIVGMQKGWSSAHPGRVLQTVMDSLVANPLIVIDEVEKAGIARDDRGRAYGLANALLPLMEPMTARNWSCPFYRVRFDMSWIGWVLTSNYMMDLSGPLISRCTVVRVEPLTIAQLTDFALREGRRRGLSDASLWAIVCTLDEIGDNAKPDLRTVSRILDRAAALENNPTLM